jgi:hypothetical protein
LQKRKLINLQARSLHLHNSELARALHNKCLALVVQITPLPLVDLVDLHTILIILVVVQVVAALVNYNFFVILFSLSLTALIKKLNYGLS